MLEQKNSYASGGMNILPQLVCLLPNKIDEFANVSEIGNQSNFNVRLNVITEKGATVKINGTTHLASMVPFPVQGTTDWETLCFPNVSGNISIESTKAVTARYFWRFWCCRIWRLFCRDLIQILLFLKVVIVTRITLL